MLHVTGNQKKAGVACPSTIERIRKIWHFYSVESYSAIKKDDHKALVGKWVQLVIMLLGEMVWTYMGEHQCLSSIKY